MNKKFSIAVLALAAPLTLTTMRGEEPKVSTVNVDNFKRVETDLYFAKTAKEGAFGKFMHNRTPTEIDKQDVIRMNRDTLYSFAVVDLAAGPATVSLPDAKGRFMSLQVIDQDHYTPEVIYKPGDYVFDHDKINTRYVLFLVRTFVDPNSDEDIKATHAAQDQLKITQKSKGSFEIPEWDTKKAAEIRNLLNQLSAVNGGIDSARMFGPKDKVDPVQHLLGTAAGWGGNPPEAAIYVGGVPENNNGKAVYQVTIKDVPVDGFWSISVYNEDGFFEKNDRNVYSVNNVTAKPNADGSVTVQFGGDPSKAPNCIPTPPGWNYIVRLYRPQKSILDGSWKFPDLKLVE